jgi:hypothetical protein
MKAPGAGEVLARPSRTRGLSFPGPKGLTETAQRGDGNDGSLHTKTCKLSTRIEG